MNIKSAIFAVALAGAATAANADTINFGAFGPDGTTLANTAIGSTSGGTLFAITAPGAGATVLEQDVSWGGTFNDNAPVYYDNGVSGAVSIVFLGTIHSITDLAVQSNLYGAYTATLTAYNGVTVLGTETVSGLSTYAPNTAPSFSFSSTGQITQLVISSTNDSEGFGLSTSAVPEVSTWAMMLAGFAGLGVLGYRRNKAASVAA